MKTKLATRIRRLIEDIIAQAIRRTQAGGFPGIVISHLGPVPTPNGTHPGVLTQRMIVQPKVRLMNHLGEEVPLPRLISVPVKRYKVGPFLRRGPFAPGQRVWVSLGKYELHRLIMDAEIRHPGTQEIYTLNTASVEPDGVRMDADPFTPGEALDADYFAVVGEDNNPIGKRIWTPDGKLYIWTPEYILHCPKINLGAISDLDVIRREVDKDDDSETNGPDIHPKGSQCTKCATESDYAAGITEPMYYGGAGGGGGEAEPTNQETEAAAQEQAGTESANTGEEKPEGGETIPPAEPAPGGEEITQRGPDGSLLALITGREGKTFTLQAALLRAGRAELRVMDLERRVAALEDALYRSIAGGQAEPVEMEV